MRIQKSNENLIKRWIEGVRAITPYQRARIIYFNTYIMVIGILAGLVVTLFFLKTAWWLTIILLAALINTFVVQIGNYQNYATLREIFDV